VCHWPTQTCHHARPRRSRLRGSTTRSRVRAMSSCSWLARCGEPPRHYRLISLLQVAAFAASVGLVFAVQGCATTRQPEPIGTAEEYAASRREIPPSYSELYPPPWYQPPWFGMPYPYPYWFAAPYFYLPYYPPPVIRPRPRPRRPPRLSSPSPPPEPTRELKREPKGIPAVHPSRPAKGNAER
jgi:hypothetical protein